MFSLLLAGLRLVNKRFEKISGILAFLGLVISLIFVFKWFYFYQQPIIISLTEIFPGISSYFRIDLFSIFLSFLSLAICSLIVLFNFHYRCKNKISYYILLLLCEFGILGIAFSYDLFSFFVFWEIMTISSYFLITFGGQTDELEALKYIFISAAGSTILLFSLALIFGQTNSLNFVDIANFVKIGQPYLVKFIFVLTIICFAIKSGIVPFNTWVPDTYQEAYTPTTAWFSSILTKVGLFALLRILFIFLPIQSFYQIILMILAFFTMFLGNILALFEQNFKRLLAFSSIAQIGYILFAISIFTLDSITAGLLHMINHAIVKAMMFFIASICIYETGKKNLNEMRGIGRVNKLLGLAIIVGTFTLIGIPTFNIFVSELLTILAGVEAGYLIPVGLFLFNIFLSLFFYIRILRELILRKYSKGRTIRIPLSMQIPILFLVILCILFGLYPSAPIEFCKMVAVSLFK